MARLAFLLVPSSVVLASLVLVPRSARADDGEASLAAISEGAAREAAVQIACASPPSRRWLRGSLRDLSARRWGMLETTLRRETIDLVGDAVYAAAKENVPRDPRAPERVPPSADPLRHLLGDPKPTCEEADRRAALGSLSEADVSEPSTDVDRCLARGLAERRRDPACALAASVRAALEGDAPVARANLADVVAAATFDAMYTGKSLTEAQKDAVFEHVAYELREVIVTEPNDETIDADVMRAFGNLDIDAVRGWRCKDRELVRDLADGNVDPQDSFCSATRSELDPTKIVVSLTGPGGKKSTTNLEGLLIIASAATHAALADTAIAPPDRDQRVADAILCALPLGPEERAYADCSSGVLRSNKPGAFKLGIENATWTITVGKTPKSKVESAEHYSLAVVVDNLLETLRLRDDIATLIRDKILGDDPPAGSMRELATTALRLRRIARALDDLTVATDRRPTILAVLDGLPSLVPRFAGAPASRPACSAAVTALDRMRCAADGPLRSLVVTAENARVRELATRVSTLVGARGRAATTRCSSAQGARLLGAFAADIDVTGDPLSIEQMRTTAPDVARCAPEERREHEEGRFAFTFLPAIALRASWNGAYLNEWGGDGFRLVPSLDVGTMRVRLSPDNARLRAGFDVSVIDVLAPISELALRRSDLRYDRQGSLWLDAVRPRIDLVFGLPQVSRHLAFVVGTSLRLVAPYRGGGDAAAPKTANDATYLLLGTPGSATSESFASFFEWNIAAKYVF